MKRPFTVVLAAILLFTAGIQSAAAQPPCGDHYVVQRGEYLASIARKCDVKLSALIAANPEIANRNLIYPGQVLIIPDGNPPIPVTGGSVYIVKPGDTLRKIAALFQVSLDDLIDANPGISNPNVIYAGQQVRLPEGAAQVPAASITPTSGKPGAVITLGATGFRANLNVEIAFGPTADQVEVIGKAVTDGNGALLQRVTVPAGAQANKTYIFLVRAVNGSEKAVSNPFQTSAGGSTGSTAYTVQRGDSLRSIAARYTTSVAAILLANPSIGNPGVIYVGQRLSIPSGAVKAQVAVTPRTAPAGAGIFVVAGGFPANQDVDIDLGLENGAFKVLLDAHTDSTGYINKVIHLPASATAGQRYVVRVRTTNLRPGVAAVSNAVTIR